VETTYPDQFFFDESVPVRKPKESGKLASALALIAGAAWRAGRKSNASERILKKHAGSQDAY
jgi:hypothetical protein